MKACKADKVEHVLLPNSSQLFDINICARVVFVMPAFIHTNPLMFALWESMMIRKSISTQRTIIFWKHNLCTCMLHVQDTRSVCFFVPKFQFNDLLACNLSIDYFIQDQLCYTTRTLGGGRVAAKREGLINNRFYGEYPIHNTNINISGSICGYPCLLV